MTAHPPLWHQKIHLEHVRAIVCNECARSVLPILKLDAIFGTWIECRGVAVDGERAGQSQAALDVGVDETRLQPTAVRWFAHVVESKRSFQHLWPHQPVSVGISTARAYAWQV